MKKMKKMEKEIFKKQKHCVLGGREEKGLCVKVAVFGKRANSI